MALGIDHPDVLALAGSWNAMLHPRNPAGSSAGGKFASGKSGGGGAGKGGAKGAKGAGKGGAAAAAAAQAKIIAPQFLAMNPQQRSAFLANLSNPQLSALYKAINAGNSNDPSTKAALIAIKDQMAARSLTGAKGPTATNAAKAASASKSAAGKQASAAKKSASAAASTAKKTSTAQATAAKKQLASAKAAASAAAKAQKATVANQAAALKAQAAMQQTSQKAKVAGLTSALKATTNPAQQQQILAQLKTALGLSQGFTRENVEAALRLPRLMLGYMPNASSGDGAAITVNADLRNKYAKQGVALPDGSFPIPDKTHLRMALKAVGRAHPSKRPAVRAHIRKRAKALGVDLRDSAVGNGG